MPININCRTGGAGKNSGGGEPVITEAVINADGWDENVQRIAAAAISKDSVILIQPRPGTSKETIDALRALDAHDHGQGSGWLELIVFGELNTSDITVQIIIFNSVREAPPALETIRVV